VLPANHLEPGACSGPITSEPVEFPDLEIGAHELSFEALDPFGHAHSCLMKFDVVDTVAPEVQCPILWSNPEGFLVEGMLTTSDHCESNLEFVSGSCANVDDEEVLCGFSFDNGLLSVDVQAPADDVLWTMRATDSSGNENLHNCWMPLPEPNFGPKPDSGGCAVMTHRSKAPSASLAILMLLFCCAFFTIRNKAW